MCIEEPEVSIHAELLQNLLEWMAALRCDMQQASAIIEKNERICQVYFAPVEMPEEMMLEGLDGEISTVPTFFDIAREGGIGSTGTT